jgi:hypothetical protein
MQSTFPPVFRMPFVTSNEDSAILEEIAIADSEPFNVRITNDDASVDIFAAVFNWNSRQYIFADVLPSTAIIEVLQ